jgi:uncharacterized membrane protein
VTVLLLDTIALLGTGITAGVFFAVAVSVVPTLAALTPSTYVEVHQLLGKGYHPWMPLIVTAALLSDLAAAVLTPGPGRWLLLVAAVMLAGVQVVSQFRNVPINRVVGRLAPADLPVDWPDPRAAWRSWHLLRTAFAMLALAATSLAVAAG